jgi:hypothetical protein
MAPGRMHRGQSAAIQASEGATSTARWELRRSAAQGGEWPRSQVALLQLCELADAAARRVRLLHLALEHRLGWGRGGRGAVAGRGV